MQVVRNNNSFWNRISPHYWMPHVYNYTLLLTMYYYLELLKYLTWSVSVSTQQQNVYKTTWSFHVPTCKHFWNDGSLSNIEPPQFSSHLESAFKKDAKSWDSIFCPVFIGWLKKLKWNRGRCFSFKNFQYCTAQKSVDVFFARKWSAIMWYVNIKGGI